MKSAPASPVRRVLTAAVTAAVLCVVAMTPVHADTQSQLSSAEAKLNRLIKRIASESKTVSALEAQASVLAGQIDAVQSRIAQTEQTIVGVESDISTATTQLLADQAQLDERARVAYETGLGSGLEFLLGSTSLADFNDRLQIVNSAAQSDTSLIDKVQAQRTRLQEKQFHLQELQNQLHATQAGLAVQQAALQGKLDSAKTVLDSLSADRASAQRLVGQLKAKRARELYLARLAAQRARESQGPPSSGRGSISGVLLVCPVDQPHAYSDDFGAPRYGGGFHNHQGNDIVAPQGTPIRAPFNGSATDSTNDLGGLSVTVTGAAGYVYNAHLSALGTLGLVTTGTIIGYVGSTGDAQGGVTHDHFEWHPNVIPKHLWVSPYGFSLINGAIDPFPYLNSVC